MIRRTIKAAAAFAFAVSFGACAEASGPEIIDYPDLTHDPILFVHGYLGNGGNWEDMKTRFKADGWKDYELYAYNYSFTASNATSAAEIRDQVTEIIRTTGATKVDIVAFSMGSISSRYYLKNFDGATKIDAWVSMGGPNHGTDAVENNNCQFTPCREIIPGSVFLAALNSGDETPGALVRYATWRSPCDTTINPDETVILTGATNNLAPCIGHLEFLTNATVYQQVRAFVQ